MLNSLSWKQVLINAIAFWLISNGCGILSLLNEVELAEIARQHANLGRELPKDGTEMVIGKMFIGTAIASVLGLLVAFFTSLVASARRKWYWVNAVLGLALIVSVNLMLPLDNYALLRLPLGQLAGAWYYIFYGTTMVITGIMLLWPKKHIAHHHKNNNTTPSTNYA